MWSDMQGIEKSKTFITGMVLVGMALLIFAINGFNKNNRNKISDGKEVSASVTEETKPKDNFGDNSISKGELDFLYLKKGMQYKEGKKYKLVLRNVAMKDNRMIIHYEIECKDDNYVSDNLYLFVDEKEMALDEFSVSSFTSVKERENYSGTKLYEAIYIVDEGIDKNSRFKVTYEDITMEFNLYPYDSSDKNVSVKNDIALITSTEWTSSYVSVDAITLNYSEFEEVCVPINATQIGHEYNYIRVNGTKIRCNTSHEGDSNGLLNTWHMEFSLSELGYRITPDIMKDMKLYIPGLIVSNNTDVYLEIDEGKDDDSNYKYEVVSRDIPFGEMEVVSVSKTENSLYDCRFIFYLRMNDEKYEYIPSDTAKNADIESEITFGDYCTCYGEYDCVNKLCVYSIKKMLESKIEYIKISQMNYWMESEYVINSESTHRK